MSKLNMAIENVHSYLAMLTPNLPLDYGVASNGNAILAFEKDENQSVSLGILQDEIVLMAFRYDSSSPVSYFSGIDKTDLSPNALIVEISKAFHSLWWQAKEAGDFDMFEYLGFTHFIFAAIIENDLALALAFMQLASIEGQEENFFEVFSLLASAYRYANRAREYELANASALTFNSMTGEYRVGTEQREDFKLKQPLSLYDETNNADNYAKQFHAYISAMYPDAKFRFNLNGSKPQNEIRFQPVNVRILTAEVDDDSNLVISSAILKDNQDEVVIPLSVGMDVAGFLFTLNSVSLTLSIYRADVEEGEHHESIQKLIDPDLDLYTFTFLGEGRLETTTGLTIIDLLNDALTWNNWMVVQYSEILVKAVRDFEWCFRDSLLLGEMQSLMTRLNIGYESEIK